MLQRGDLLPHFIVTTLDGERVEYRQIWQQKNLVLVTLAPGSPAGHDYAAHLLAQREHFSRQNTVVALTQDPMPGVPAPAAVIADQWGEIIHIAVASEPGGLPTPDELLDWITYVETRCPECEGEAR